MVNAAYTSIGRSNLYGFLAAIYREEPTADLLRGIKEPLFLQALGGVGITLDEDLLDCSEEQLVSDLSLEYTRLFIGPGKHVSPHGSVHTIGDGGSLWGRSTVAVKEFVESVGIEFRSEYHGMPDHISVELEFMQKVTEAETRAWQRWDLAQVAYFRKTGRRFVAEHLAKWVPGFCEKVINETECSFYREMARLTKDFISVEQQELQSLEQSVSWPSPEIVE